MTHAALPKVSVCIPTYNYARFLPEAIESVIAQSFTDFEVLVIDDCSRDGTPEVVREYAGRDPRIDFRKNPVNLGMVENWNLCLRLARGEYIKFLFGDDAFCSNDAMRRMVDVLDSEKSVSLVASARNVVDETSRVIDVWSGFPDAFIRKGGEVIRLCLESQMNLIGEPSVVMFRKAQSMRGFNRRYRHLMDEEMWFHLLEQGRFAYIGEPLCVFRQHRAQQTRINAELGVDIDDMFLLFDEYLARYGRSGATKNRIDRAYLEYTRAHRIWKELRTGRIDPRDAFRRISECYGIPGFFLLFPFYKFYCEYRRARWRSARKSLWR